MGNEKIVISQNGEEKSFDSVDEANNHMYEIRKDKYKTDRIKIFEDITELHEKQRNETSDENWNQVQKSFNILLFVGAIIAFLFADDLVQKMPSCIKRIIVIIFVVICFLLVGVFKGKKISAHIDIKLDNGRNNYEVYLTEKSKELLRAKDNIQKQLEKRNTYNNILMILIVVLLGISLYFVLFG